MNDTIRKEYFGVGTINHIKDVLDFERPERILLVTGKTSYSKSGAKEIISPLLEKYTVQHFNGFSHNPKFKDILKGIKIFKGSFDLVIAVGGGSSIDMAKLINILSAQDGEPIDYIKKNKTIDKKGKTLIAVPTTAGSGSEATHFAVVYVKGIKYSLAHKFILPKYSIIDPKLTMSMPKTVAASTAMDAFSQAVESYWSINSTEESKKYAEHAIKLILPNVNESVNNPTLETRKKIVEASNFAGKAINITKTTAAHALSYTFTIKYGVSHGHAVALTLGKFLEYNSGVTEKDCNDKRGKDYVKKIMKKLLEILGCPSSYDAKLLIKNMMNDIGLETYLEKIGIKKEDVEYIISNINYERLKNNPRNLDDKNKLIELLNSQNE